MQLRSRGACATRERGVPRCAWGICTGSAPPSRKNVWFVLTDCDDEDMCALLSSVWNNDLAVFQISTFEEQWCVQRLEKTKARMYSRNYETASFLRANPMWRRWASPMYRYSYLQLAAANRYGGWPAPGCKPATGKQTPRARPTEQLHTHTEYWE